MVVKNKYINNDNQLTKLDGDSHSTNASLWNFSIKGKRKLVTSFPSPWMDRSISKSSQHVTPFPYVMGSK
jgi:hypothetical protein